MRRAGCGSDGLSASSTCKDFAEASPENQARAISSLSSKFDTPEYATPLGSSEVGSYCAGNPETTLEEFFERAHKSEGGSGALEGTGTTEEGGQSDAINIEGGSEVEELLAGKPQRGLTLGAANAPVELIEFGDLQCPVCKVYSEEQIPALIKGLVSEGKVKLTFRNFAIIGPESVPAGAAALAAGAQDRGWTFIQLFYRNQGTVPL